MATTVRFLLHYSPNNFCEFEAYAYYFANAFNVVRLKVTEAVGNNNYELFWIDDESRVVLNKPEDLATAVEYAMCTRKSEHDTPCVRLLAVDTAPTATDPELATDDASPELAAYHSVPSARANSDDASACLSTDYSVSAMLDSTLSRLELALAQAELLQQKPAVDPLCYSALAANLKKTTFEVQLVIAASLPSDGPIVDSLASTAAEAERVVAQLESRANAWKQFSTARNAANKQYDALCIRLDKLWAANKLRQQQKVVVSTKHLNDAHALLDELSRHQDTIACMKKWALELEPLELPFEEIRSLEDSVPQMVRNGQDLVNELWKQDKERLAASDALWIKCRDLRDAFEENQLNTIHDLYDLGQAYVLRRQEQRRPTESELASATSEAQAILNSLRQTRADLKELGDQLVKLGRFCAYGSFYIDSWIDKTIDHAEKLVEKLKEEEHEQMRIENATNEGNAEVKSNRTYGDHVYLLYPEDPRKWIILSTDADIDRLMPCSENPVRLDDVSTPDTPDHPLDQDEAWAEYLTLKQDAETHFQRVQATLVKLGREMMERKRDGLSATYDDLNQAKAVHEDALVTMESLAKLQQQRNRLDLQNTKAFWDDQCFYWKLKHAHDNAEWLETKLSAELKAIAEAARQDAEARLYHLEVRLAELGFDRVQRQEDGTRATAVDFDAAVHAAEHLTILLDRLGFLRKSSELYAGLGSVHKEVKNAIRDAYWLMESIKKEINEVDSLEKKNQPEVPRIADNDVEANAKAAAEAASQDVEARLYHFQELLHEFWLDSSLRKENSTPATEDDFDAMHNVIEELYHLEDMLYNPQHEFDHGFIADAEAAIISMINSAYWLEDRIEDEIIEGYSIKSAKCQPEVPEISATEENANAKEEVEITREDAEARLYHLEVRLAELGFDRVMRQEDGTRATAGDFDAAEHALEELMRLNGKVRRRSDKEDLASLKAEIGNAIGDAHWLLDVVTEELHKVHPLDKRPSFHPGFPETSSSKRVTAWNAFMAAFDEAEIELHSIHQMLEELGLDISLRRQSPFYGSLPLPATTIDDDERAADTFLHATYALKAGLNTLRRLSGGLDPLDRSYSNIETLAAKFQLASDNAAWLIKNLKEERRANAKALFDSARQTASVLLYQCQEHLSELGFEFALRKQENRQATKLELKQARACTVHLWVDTQDRYTQLVRELRHIDTSYIPDFEAEFEQLFQNAEWLVWQLNDEIDGIELQNATEPGKTTKKSRTTAVMRSTKEALERRLAAFAVRMDKVEEKMKKMKVEKAEKSKEVVGCGLLRK